MTVDFTEFLDMTAEELYDGGLNYITTRDSMLQDTSVATFNSILAEAVASEFRIFFQLLKQKVKDSSVLTAEGDALSAIVLSAGGQQSHWRPTVLQVQQICTLLKNPWHSWRHLTGGSSSRRIWLRKRRL